MHRENAAASLAIEASALGAGRRWSIFRIKRGLSAGSKESSRQRDGATDDGRAAINASAADLAHQRDLAEEAKQSAYFLVDFANFARAGIKHLKATGRTVGVEIAGFGAESWRAVRRGAPKGIERGAEHAGKALVVGGVAALMHLLGSDVAALGSMVAPYVPLREMLQKMTGAAPSAPTSEPDASPPSSDDADDAPAPRTSKSRRAKVRKRGKT